MSMAHRRLVDSAAIFLCVAACEVPAVAERFGAARFDIEGTHWSHRGDRCTFGVMIEEFGLASPALQRLAAIARGADTAQFKAGMAFHDAFFRWSRDAIEKVHDWPAGKPA